MRGPISQQEPSEQTVTRQPQQPLGSGLFLVATPIGHLSDITLRALEVLSAAEIVACEDTRVTRRLLTAHGIGGPERLLAYHEHNAAAETPRLVERIRAGASVALVSDAGTPLLADPGFLLVRACRAAGLPVTAVPGPSAAITALQLSGLPAERFLFAGFLPVKSAARRGVLESLKSVPATLIFYEAPHRLAAALADLVAVLGPRPAAVARELTKFFEEVRGDSLDALARHYAEAGAPKGEIVLLVGPPPDEPAAEEADLDGLLAAALRRESLRDAVAAVAAATGQPKRLVYARALALTQESGDGGA